MSQSNKGKFKGDFRVYDVKTARFNTSLLYFKIAFWYQNDSRLRLVNHVFLHCQDISSFYEYTASCRIY